MASTSPYQAPTARVDDEQGPEQYAEIKILSAAGRIGRARYIAYSIALTILGYLVIGSMVALGTATGIPAIGTVGIAIGFIGMIAVGVLLTIQRCHDFNASGWLALLIVVPLAPLVFWLVSGTSGANRFGNPPPPNTTGVIVLASLLPVLFVLGILAAVAIPAYQDYVARAAAHRTK
jgi:uncharacterized membrane protein YhaH (DUF805 family)